MDDNQLQTIAKLANARIDELFAGGQVRSIPQITVGMVRIVLAVEDELICASVDAVTQPQQANEGTAHTNGPPVAHPVVEQAMREIARAVERHEQRQEAGRE